MQDSKLLPHDLKAEQNVLGVILADPNNHDTFADLNDILQDYHFYHALHLKIYRSMTELYDKSLPISTSSIASVLKDDKDYISNDGDQYLSIEPERFSFGITLLWVKLSSNIFEACIDTSENTFGTSKVNAAITELGSHKGFLHEIVNVKLEHINNLSYRRNLMAQAIVYMHCAFTDSYDIALSKAFKDTFM